ncbi:unnamed protein product, partial [Gordionus sp. m RMFG-2023]
MIVIQRLLLSSISIVFPTRLAGPYRRCPLRHLHRCPWITYRPLYPYVAPHVATIPCRTRIQGTVTSQVINPATSEVPASFHRWLVATRFPTTSSHPGVRDLSG